MVIPFLLDGVPAAYRRSALTGRATLVVGDQVITVQSPYRFSTQFQLKTRNCVEVTVNGRRVDIVKDRPVLVGGLRRSSYAVSVDGQPAAEAIGF